MKKYLLILTISCVLTVAHSQTNVSGGIFSNTTWTLANSPYIVTDTVVVFPGVTLTIQPGVTIKFDNNKRLEIRQAYLIANGTSTDSITFTSNSTSPSMGIWGNIYLSGYINSNYQFNYCNFKYADIAIMKEDHTVQLYINNSSFINNNYGIRLNPFLISSYPLEQIYIDSTNFIDNFYGTDYFEQGKISNSIFAGNYIGTMCQHTNIDSCIFKHNTHLGLYTCGIGQHTINCIIDSNDIGIQMNWQNDSIINCRIRYNSIGIKDTGNTCIVGYGSYVTKNIIENNSIGIQLSCSYDSNSKFICNRICNNSSYDLKYTGTCNINISNNYWCTTDSTSTKAQIYDGRDNINFGLANFMPLDTVQCYNCNILISATVINASYPLHNGSATATVTGGAPPYSYSWNTSPVQTTQTATGLQGGRYYSVCVTDSSGCNNCLYNIYVDSTGLTVVNNVSPVNLFLSISPNPFSTQTTLQTDNPFHNVTLSVDNCFGQTVMQIKNLSGQSITFHRDNLPSGLYFVRLTQDNKVIATKKLLITD